MFVKNYSGISAISRTESSHTAILEGREVILAFGVYGDLGLIVTRAGVFGF